VFEEKLGLHVITIIIMCLSDRISFKMSSYRQQQPHLLHHHDHDHHQQQCNFTLIEPPLALSWLAGIMLLLLNRAYLYVQPLLN